MTDLPDRVKDLENWRVAQDQKTAVEAIERGYMDKRFDVIEAHLSKIDEKFSKVIWGILGILILAIGKFIIGGGLGLAP